MQIDIDSLSGWLGLAAALGIASMGVVEAFKWTRLGAIGLGAARRVLGAGMLALEQAYGGAAIDAILNGAYRRGPAEFGEMLRNGIKVGLASGTAERLGVEFGVDPRELEALVHKARASDLAPAPSDLALLGRFHLAVDARVDAAVAVSTQTYDSSMRLVAGIVAVVGTTLGLLASRGPDATLQDWAMALAVAAVAVPLAPASKELVNFLTAVRKLLAARGSSG